MIKRFKKILMPAWSQLEGDIMKCLACQVLIENCECTWSAIRSLQENIRKCVTFDVVHSNSKNCQMWQEGCEQKLNAIMSRLNKFEMRLLVQDQQSNTKKIEKEFPSFVIENSNFQEKLKNLTDDRDYWKNRCEIYKRAIDVLKNDMQNTTGKHRGKGCCNGL